jgi:hypothetical protein
LSITFCSVEGGLGAEAFLVLITSIDTDGIDEPIPFPLLFEDDDVDDTEATGRAGAAVCLGLKASGTLNAGFIFVADDCVDGFAVVALDQPPGATRG